LYVVNENDNNIVQFAIGSDGKIYPENTVNTPGVYPLAVAVTATNLFVLDTYEPLSSCSIASPCSGSVAVFPLAAASGDPPSDMIGPLPVANPANSLNSWPLTLASSPTDVVEPTAIDVLASGSYAYVTAYDATTGADYIFGFSIGAGGALTPLNSGNPLLTFATGSCSNAYLKAPFIVGTCPSAIASASNSAGNYLYVTDTVNGKIHGYKIAVSGALSEVGGSPYAAGNQPTAIAADSSYPYLYVANTQDGNVEAYSISASGELSFADGSTTPVVYDAGLEPVAIGIDPSTNHFVFTANYLGNNVSDFELNATTGTLIDAEHSPFKSNALVTAVAAVPHHATQQH
jgi:6-phosphogluconolactonase (cycloisomerase 2 family)